MGVYGDFEYEERNGSIRLTGYTGNAGSPVLPVTIGELPVAEIGDGVFENCESLISIEIPKEYVGIGKSAFRNCRNLSSVAFGSGTREELVGETAVESKLPGTGAAFVFSGGRELVHALGVRRIKECAFAGCESLEELALPAGLDRIPYGMLMGCKHLKRVTLPEALNEIEIYAFRDCVSLESLRLPKSLRWVNRDSFEHCEGLRILYGEEAYTYEELDAFCRWISGL